MVEEYTTAHISDMNFKVYSYKSFAIFLSTSLLQMFQ